MTDSSARYDVVVYGATGYTGKYVVEEVARVAQMETVKSQPFSWAVAGRNKEKLDNTIAEARAQTGLPMEDVGMVVADVGDPASLDQMTSKAKVVINCVGPYIKYGEPVVTSCINNGASHVDLSGEPLYLEGMQLKYNDMAREKEVYIVGACGYDAVAADVGVAYLDKQFPGGVNNVDMFMESTGPPAPMHTGTMESALGIAADKGAHKQLQGKLFPQQLPKAQYPIPSRSSIYYSTELEQYGVLFPADMPVVYRSQRYRYDVEGRLPIQFRQYMKAPSYCQALGMSIGTGYFNTMGSMSWTRNLVLKHPESMTGGVFSREGATREELKKMGFSMTLVGHGWSQPQSDPIQRDTPPDSTKIIKAEGPDPAYTATSLILVASAMTILREKDNCHGRGGVLTPGIAFGNTSIIDRLISRGIKWQVQDL